MAARRSLDLRNYTDLHYDSSKNNFNSLPVYGPFERLFVSDWGQSDIHYDITLAFDKMNIKCMSPLQQNSFLYLMNNHNIAMVGHSKGKSTSYLASIFSLIMKNSDNNKCNNGLAPKAIILSSSLGSCFELENLSNQLLSLSKYKIKVVLACSSIPVQKTIAALCNGCDIFISTPSAFYDILLKTKLFSWSNLKHVVYDNIDILLENYKDQMVHFSKIISSVKEKINNLQMIAVSVKWTNGMHTFISLLFFKWQYIFGSHLEAARFMNVRFSVVQVENNKLEKITENLKHDIKWRRCVLVTSDPKELRKIYEYIRKSDAEIEILLPDEIRSAKIYTFQKWSAPLEEKKLLMICSDNMFYDFYIDNADCLIHYDVPDQKKTFTIRFSVLQDSTTSLIERERSTYVYVSNSNKDMLQWPKIVETIRHFGNDKVPQVLLEQSKLIKQTLEKEKKHCLLCDSVMQFGFCSKPTTCQSRHIILKEIDGPVDNFPRSGLAVVEILHVYNASHLSVKVLSFSHTDNLNEPFQNWTTLNDFSDTIDNGLNCLYRGHNSRLLHENPVIGEVVAVQLDIKQRKNAEFFRAIVIDFIDTNTLNPKLTVKLIDLGYVDTVSKWNVFSLPEEWKKVCTTTADVFVASVKPVDLDKTWCSKADSCTKRELQFAKDCNSIFIINIKMTLGTTIWVKNLYKKIFEPKFNVHEYKPILPDILFNYGFADPNVEHMEILIELSDQAGIEVQPLLLYKNNVKENHNNLSLDDFMSLYKLPLPQWAHLDECAVIIVTLEFIISPKMFFVRNSKYIDRIYNLEKIIAEFVEDKKVDKLKHIIPGALCLAKHQNSEQYSRGQIVELGHSGCVEILFVDIGEFVWVESDSLLTIHPNMISQLPFQAVECGLSGVKDLLPLGEELNELSDYVFDLIQESVYLKVTDSFSSSKFTGGNHYEVILYDDFIKVNFEFMKKFGHYCDIVQMNKLKQLLENESSENNNEQHCAIDETDLMPEGICKEMFDKDDDLSPSELETVNMFYNQFGLDAIGPMYEELMKMSTENAKDLKIELSTTKTEVSEPVIAATENKHSNCLIATTSSEKSQDAQCIVPVDSKILEKPHSSEKRKLKLNLKRQNPCLSCNTPMKSIIVPVCVWYQDDNNIYLKFNILEIDELLVDCTIQNITFNAQFRDTLYTFTVDLYASIIDTNVTHRSSYEGFHIKAEKLYKTHYKWPRLFSCDKWHRYVKYDIQKLRTKDNQLWMRKVNQFKMLGLNRPLLQLIDNSNDSDASLSEDCDNLYED